MNLEHLRTYTEIVRRGSFSEAAKALGLSQPAVTFQIQRLERTLAVRLLERGEGRVTLTAAGEEFYRFALRVLEEQEALRQRLQSLTEEVRGRLLIGASTVPGEFLLPKLLGEFVQRYPGVEASVAIADTDAVVQKVLALECDIGFVGAQVEARHLKLVPFLEDDIKLIVAPSHPFAPRESIRLEELREETLLSREAGSGTMRSVRQLLSEAGFDWSGLGAAPIFGSTQAIVAAVEAGLGIAFVSGYAIRHCLQLGLVRTVGIEGITLKRGLYIIYLENRLMTRLLQEFLAFAESWAITHGQDGGG